APIASVASADCVMQNAGECAFSTCATHAGIPPFAGPRRAWARDLSLRSMKKDCALQGTGKNEGLARNIALGSHNQVLVGQENHNHGEETCIATTPASRQRLA